MYALVSIDCMSVIIHGMYVLVFVSEGWWKLTALDIKTVDMVSRILKLMGLWISVRYGVIVSFGELRGAFLPKKVGLQSHYDMLDEIGIWYEWDSKCQKSYILSWHTGISFFILKVLPSTPKF